MTILELDHSFLCHGPNICARVLKSLPVLPCWCQSTHISVRFPISLSEQSFFFIVPLLMSDHRLWPLTFLSVSPFLCQSTRFISCPNLGARACMSMSVSQSRKNSYITARVPISVLEHLHLSQCHHFGVRAFTSLSVSKSRSKSLNIDVSFPISM